MTFDIWFATVLIAVGVFYGMFIEIGDLKRRMEKLESKNMVKYPACNGTGRKPEAK